MTDLREERGIPWTLRLRAADSGAGGRAPDRCASGCTSQRIGMEPELDYIRVSVRNSFEADRSARRSSTRRPCHDRGHADCGG